MTNDSGLNSLERSLLEASVVRMRARVMGLGLGAMCGSGLFLVTAWLVIRGGPDVGRHLGLLRHYLPGYSVTWPGAVLGFGYGALIGAVAGWLLARVYNRVAKRSL